jgi:hypothetical protein
VEEAVEQQLQEGPGFDFFEFVPADCVLRVMEFLDPYAFMAFSLTSQRHRAVFKS